MFIIKFGGSVITDKRRKNTFDAARTGRLVSEINLAHKKTIVVHGAGSFGHILAKKFELHMGFKKQEQIRALAEVQRDVKELNLMVLNAFLENEISAVSLAPSAFLLNENGLVKSMEPSLMKGYFDMGITPISFGDVVLDEALKFSICSGDQLMLEFARAFHPEKAIFVADIDGIFTSDPAADPNAELIPVINGDSFPAVKKTESTVDDVTGGIFGKLDIMFKIAALGVETLIVNGTVENRLKDALSDKEVISTRIESKN
ncbi:MAG: isopentenyl phosphate kinase family protein [Methanomassiliicoccales archaeon]|nr:MAG: isopentenyl phosphate kinase family protein [Methanomassiliicoccales archaeon]